VSRLFVSRRVGHPSVGCVSKAMDQEGLGHGHACHTYAEEALQVVDINLVLGWSFGHHCGMRQSNHVVVLLRFDGDVDGGLRMKEKLSLALFIGKSRLICWKSRRGALLSESRGPGSANQHSMNRDKTKPTGLSGLNLKRQLSLRRSGRIRV
jgi:hypothetical protein